MKTSSIILSMSYSFMNDSKTLMKFIIYTPPPPQLLHSLMCTFIIIDET